MLDPANYDPRPLHVRIKELLARYPLGLHTRELADLMPDVPMYSISSVVSKLNCYGAGIEKVGAGRGQHTVWKLRK